MLLRGLTLTLLLLLGSGCSRTDFAYRNADWFIERFARQAVDASAGQRERWEPVVQATLQQHRETVLPLVIRYLDTLDQALQSQQDAAGVECLLNGARLLYDRHAELAVALSAPLLAELDAGQIEHLSTHLAERHSELLERYRLPDPQGRQAARVERITGRIERWTGRLGDDQRQQLEEDIRRMPDLTGQWLAYRARQNAALLQLLEAGANEPALQTFLSGWWVEREGQPAAMTRRWEIAMRDFVNLLQTLGRTLTDRQRVTLQTRIADLRQDLAAFQPAARQSTQQQTAFDCGPSTV
jgi:hypothetical protein